jgi:hypothetical protein
MTFEPHGRMTFRNFPLNFLGEATNQKFSGPGNWDTSGLDQPGNLAINAEVRKAHYIPGEGGMGVTVSEKLNVYTITMWPWPGDPDTTNPTVFQRCS